MISFFRRLINSKVGVVLMLGFVGLIAIAFVAGDIGNTGFGGGGGVRGAAVATVDGDPITDTELTERVRREYDAARRQAPELSFADYLAGGGVDGVLERMISSVALDVFAEAQGMTVSPAMEVAQIQQIPNFRGLDGNFDRALFEQTLRSLNLSEGAFRAELAREMLASQLLVPVSGAARAPNAIVRQQANLQLEERSGWSIFVPVAGLNVAAPSDAETEAYYRANVQRYTIPERRVIRYALVERDALPVAAPTDAEVQQAYRSNQARYAPSETRSLTQVILPDESAARALVQRVAGGQSLADAAATAGVEAATLPPQSRDALQRLSSEAVAQAAFQTSEGALSQPARSGLGWHVIRVDSVERTPGQPLEQVRADLATELTAAKRTQALSDVVARVQDEVGGGATFEEAAAATGLRVQTTAALLPSGLEAGATGSPSPLAMQIATAAFGAEVGDDPVIQEIVPDESYALVAVANIVPAAVPPLGQIAEQVTGDLRRARLLAEARRIATGIAERATGGTTLAQAAAASGGSAGGTTRLTATRRQLATSASPQTAALFGLRPNEARAFEAADGSGWHVVELDRIVPGNAAGQRDLVEATAAGLAQAASNEYAEQFLQAVRATVGVTRDDAAVARVRAALAGGAQ